MAYVREAVLNDALELAPNMKEGDVEEIKASNNLIPLEALVIPFTIPNSITYTAIGNREEPIAMFGSCPTPDEKTGVVWLLSAESLIQKTYRTRFLRECNHWIDVISKPYSYVYNHVDVRNWKSVRWLEHCGFNIIKTEPYGVHQLDFHLLMRENNV